MSRTPLFSLLRRTAQASVRDALTTHPGATPARVSRRRLLGAAVAGTGAGLLVGCGGAATTPDDGVQVPDGSQTARVAVVGGGMAGLHAAWRLVQSGVGDVVLFEASSRTGGRMYSTSTHFDGGQVAELGGELVNSDHAVMLALAAEFEEPLDDRSVLLADVAHQETFFMGGERISERALAEAWTPVAPRMAEALARSEEDEDVFATLDSMAMTEWLDAQADLDPTLRAVIEEAFKHEMGLECDRQSVLNLMYLIDSETPDPFRVLGESDERFHLHRGNDVLTTHLAQRLGDRIRTGHALQAVAALDDGRVRITVQHEGGVLEETFDHVVLAMPQTLLREVTLDLPDMPEAKRRSIAEVAYGTNAKLMSQYSRKVWRATDEVGTVITDNGLGSGWDTSVGQPGELGLFTNFVGGDNGVAMGEGTDAAQWAQRLPMLEQIFPGVADAFNGRAVRFHWPTHRWTRGSYLCYGPGQWQFYGSEGERVGNVHFCGEHTSLDHGGYMEGAASSGALVAAEIIEDLGGDPRAMLERLMGLRSLLPHSGWRAARLRQPRLLARRTWLRRIALSHNLGTRRG
jgi:monoamine oxidase